MMFLDKNVTLGDIKFTLRIDRDIAIKTIEKYPQETKFLLDFNLDGVNLLDAIDNGTIREVFDKQDKFYEYLNKIVEYALPLMLDKAGNTTNAEDIINCAKENKMINSFNIEMFGVIAQGFTLNELAKPKIKFVIE